MPNPPRPPLVLASSSPARRALLARLFGDGFEVRVPAVDEAPHAGEEPPALARRLAREKAEAIGRDRAGAVVIGADQVAVLGSRVLGKPGGPARALAQLMEVSGREVRFFTAACVLDPAGAHHEHSDVTTVRFRAFDRALAEAYLRHDEPYGCAGSFRVEGAGVVLLEEVVSRDPTALVGLPMIWLGGLLVTLGLWGPARPGSAGARPEAAP
ncbi:MAG TPA: Maf family protein [Woeseiaceae bacterium]|nr:Maf family protein [Woeseiaceae bacterium]